MGGINIPSKNLLFDENKPLPWRMVGSPSSFFFFVKKRLFDKNKLLVTVWGNPPFFPKKDDLLVKASTFAAVWGNPPGFFFPKKERLFTENKHFATVWGNPPVFFSKKRATFWGAPWDGETTTAQSGSDPWQLTLRKKWMREQSLTADFIEAKK